MSSSPPGPPAPQLPATGSAYDAARKPAAANASPTIDQQRVDKALTAVLRPVARFMIACGVTLPKTIELVKRAMIEAALKMAAKESDLSDSRVSAMTGIHRKDVRRLRRGESKPQSRSSEAIGTLLIARWTTDPNYLDSHGQPLALPRRAPAGRASFDQLAKTVSADLPAATLLGELASRNIVEIDEPAQQITLKKRAYIAEGGIDAGLEAWQKNIQAHLSAATGNLVGPAASKHFELAGHYNKLSRQSHQQLERRARELFSQALEQLNREALIMQDSDIEKNDGTIRFSLGAFTYFETLEAIEPEPRSDASKSAQSIETASAKTADDNGAQS